jgi:predicted amidophosphoribosyltransferase
MTDGSCEKHGVCPYCHGWFEELQECKICGATATEENLTLGVCNDCLIKHSTIDNCIDYGNEHKEKVEINEFLVWFFGAERINQFLIEEAKKMNKFLPIDCYEYVDNDLSSFADYIKRKE